MKIPKYRWKLMLSMWIVWIAVWQLTRLPIHLMIGEWRPIDIVVDIVGVFVGLVAVFCLYRNG